MAGAIGEVREPEAGVIQGTARTLAGRPLASFGGSISGFSTKSGETLSLNIDGVNGVYRAEGVPGQFATRAWTDVEYHGRQYRIDLDPVDGKDGRTKQDTKHGLRKDFVWKLEGFRPGSDARSDDNFYGHYGGAVRLCPEAHGAFYWSGIRHAKHEPEPKIPLDAIIEVTLTPDGARIDGSLGSPVVLTIEPAKIKAALDRHRRGIPIGRYSVTAKIEHADGTTRALRVTPYDIVGVEPPEPAETAVIEFIQSRPPSATINGVDEISLHLMY